MQDAGPFGGNGASDSFDTARSRPAQDSAKMPRIGVLDGGDPSTSESLDRVFREGLRQLGYVEGQNIAIERRWAGRRLDRLPDLAAELVRRRVSIIVAAEDPVILAAKQTTSTIPIVMSSVGDPVGAGSVASLKHPGGNITGVTNFAVGFFGKWLALLKELILKSPKWPSYGTRRTGPMTCCGRRLSARPRDWV